jgi:DNA polymerase III subunit epsilon
MFKHLRLTRPLAVIDIESTGVNPAADRVVEVAALRYAPGGKPMSFVRRVNPTVPIPPAASAVHGIVDADVADCRPFAGIARKLTRILDGCDLAGYGIKKFDLPLLVAEFRRAGLPFPLAGRCVVDALQIFHQKERRDLQAAFAFYCGGNFERAHRAGEDVRATALVLDGMLKRYRDLPRNIRDLHTRLTEADLAGRFRVVDGEPVFAFGKQYGRRLKDVARDDPAYLEWMLSGDFLDDVKGIILDALRAAGNG